MRIDERWDRISDDEWSEFASAWLKEVRFGRKTHDQDFGKSVVLMGFTARPEHMWKFILIAVRQAETDDELGHIAAGPLERLLGNHGDAFIERVELQAASDAKFSRTTTGVWKYMMSDEVWSRVQALQAFASSKPRKN